MIASEPPADRRPMPWPGTTGDLSVPVLAEYGEPLAAVPFDDPPTARRRLEATLVAAGDVPATVRGQVLGPLLTALADAPAPDASLINFERFVRASSDRTDKPPGALFRYLAANPRAVEILVRL
ncbi:MAG: hypothetical protein AAF907_08210, partial [Planctomycetota bacterium]